MFHRALTPALLQAAASMPVVTLVGPRQSGKTTLVRHAFPGHAYASLEQPDLREQALVDPVGLLDRLGTPVILDEAQRAPNLLSWIQVRVDADPSPGRYVLTGSANLPLLERVSQTLAGRTAVLRLLPLTLAELHGREPPDPAALDAVGPSASPPPAGLWPSLFAGFYPRIHDRALDPRDWLSDYRRTYVERDLRDLVRVLDLVAFDRFLRLAAARTAQELNLSDLAADAGISQPTARHWLTALELGFLATVLPPYHQSFRKRLRKRPKLHFLDSGLVCQLLGIPDAATLEVHPLRGAVFESFVVAELCKAFWNRRREPPLYHWRDATGHEVDVLVDLGTRLVPLEVKSAKTVVPETMAGIRWWSDLAGDAVTSACVVHGGDSAFRLLNVVVLPWFLR